MRTTGASRRARAARPPAWGCRALHAGRRTTNAPPPALPSEDLTTVCARTVLAAVGAGAVRQVLGAAGGVGARHQGGGDGLPLRATVTRVAARHLPLRDSHLTHSSCPPATRPDISSSSLSSG